MQPGCKTQAVYLYPVERGKSTISKLCALAFAIVLLHSAIPHSHRCNVSDSHIHRHYNCGQLTNFVQNYSGRDVFSLLSPYALPGTGQQPSAPDHAAIRLPDPSGNFKTQAYWLPPQLKFRGPPSL